MEEQLERLDAIRRFNPRKQIGTPDGELRYRRYLRALVWYLESSQRVLELICQSQTPPELESSLGSLLSELSEEETAVRAEVGRRWPLEFLEYFYKGIDQLERYRATGKSEARLLAESCFLRSVKRLDYIVFELRARENGEGPGSEEGGGTPAPVGPDPKLLGKNASRYPPEAESTAF